MQRDGGWPRGAGQAGGVREALAEEVRSRLERAGSGAFELGPAPSVLLFVGVNGTGKTTTIAKLAARLRNEGHSLVLAAGDTFRAAAIEQLRIWGERVGAPVVAQRAGCRCGRRRVRRAGDGRSRAASTRCWSTPPAASRTRCS